MVRRKTYKPETRILAPSLPHAQALAIRLSWALWFSLRKELYSNVSHSVVSDSATPWTVACQVPLSVGFSGKNIVVGCHFLLQGILPIERLKPGSPALQADSLL